MANTRYKKQTAISAIITMVTVLVINLSLGTKVGTVCRNVDFPCYTLFWFNIIPLAILSLPYLEPLLTMGLNVSFLPPCFNFTDTIIADYFVL